jgi:hypothetical protein
MSVKKITTSDVFTSSTSTRHKVEVSSVNNNTSVVHNRIIEDVLLEGIGSGNRYLSRFTNNRATGGEEPYSGGNIIEEDLVSALRLIAGGADSNGPQYGGFLTLNNEELPEFDYCVIEDNVVIGAGWDWQDYFTDVADSRFALLVVKGNLTVEAGEVFTPPVRKLGWYTLVVGDVEIDGEASMSGRGANHSPSGSDIEPKDIRIYTGTIDFVTNPYIPAIGGLGAAARTAQVATTELAAGFSGSYPGWIGTGGGGSGGLVKGNSTADLWSSGAGSSGTCYTSGVGGGGVDGDGGTPGLAGAGSLYGGVGGEGVVIGASLSARGGGGGGGNPGGQPGSVGGTADPGETGTAGIFVLACEGISGSGQITSRGSAGGRGRADNTRAGGGATGGGLALVFANLGTILTNVSGGEGGAGAIGPTNTSGGDGGDGDARILVGSF